MTSIKKKFPCKDCRGKGVFLMQSEFWVPCTKCNGTGIYYIFEEAK